MTQAESVEQPVGSNGTVPQSTDSRAAARALLWIGVAGLTAALAFTVVRLLSARQPSDPTSQRIQQLIDEANSLLKTLDDQKNSG